MEIYDGRVIHVPNVPWLKSGTVKENILFGSAYHKDEYEAIVTACGLREDFRRLPSKDQVKLTD
jgi:ABC-type multidrug transport system fused ATPase/permease subunit